MKRALLAIAAVIAVHAAGVWADEAEPSELVPDHMAYLYAADSRRADGFAQHEVHAALRKWENGRQLRVCFFSGNPVVTHLVRTIASEWNAYSGVTFDFGEEGRWYNCLDPRSGFPQIRVGFSERGYWSYVGSDSERYGGERAPSMNLERFNAIYNESRYSVENVLEGVSRQHKRMIRHEFGHALGLLHEHQNPSLQCHNEIKWEGEGNVFDYYGKPPNSWERDQVLRNVGFILLSDPDAIGGVADTASIMMYALPRDIMKNPEESICALNFNFDLSEADRAGIAQIYPRQGNGDSIAAVSPAITDANIRNLPAFLSSHEAADFRDRITHDLESDDVAIRRNARARLARLISLDPAVADLNGMIEALPARGYRYKIGVANALGNADGPVYVAGSARDILIGETNVATDAALKRDLHKALDRLH